MNSLVNQLESLLFVASKPISASVLAKFTGADVAAVKTALEELKQLRHTTGIVLLDAGDEYQLATASDNVELVKTFLNSDLREALTEATIEVLAIIAYRQPISKAEIEAIRGVNSQYSIRALLMRGLIEKTSSPTDGRGSYYQITTEFLQHLGITSVADLPDFAQLVASLKLPETPATVQNTPPEAQAEAVSEANESTDEVL
jgi:segregation and condensation protein B